MPQTDAALLALRVVFGLFLSYHGINKLRGGLAGTARWFAGMGLKWPKWQARIAATTEIGAGWLFAAGLITPIAASGIIGVMIVAIVIDHWKIGFFIFEPGEGWEYCASIAVVALVVATIGPGRWSLDNAFDLEFRGWWGATAAAALGIGGALTQLAVSYRPRRQA
ncbi:MAG: DoxX family protein [Actinobacteria bacterium]|nr:DoxX family protein [Actinomycetota bacterium]